MGAIIEGIELDLELGRHGELLGQLEALVIAHPFKERLVELQMLALYRPGRQPDALAAFHAARGRFVRSSVSSPHSRCATFARTSSGTPARSRPPSARLRTGRMEAEPRPPMRRVLGHGVLPVPPNRTIGRGDELAAVAERLRATSVQLLTLTGPGGVGKTRLALEAARAVQADFADGAHFVSLAALHRPEDGPGRTTDT